jgi:uncharacterized membrane protein HdeD (DUF308 family)
MLNQTLIKNWWLLALFGVFGAIISVIFLSKLETGFHTFTAVALVGKLILAAGACAAIGGIWTSPRGKCWPLVLNGLALITLGLVLNGVAGSRVSFRTVALLIILMAISLGVLEIVTARTQRRKGHVADGWLLDLAGVSSVGFALAFLLLGFRWIKLGPGSHTDLLWLGSYFGFSAICMLVLSLRLHTQGLSQSGPRAALP